MSKSTRQVMDFAALTMMGWANCGDDSDGRPIGYAVEATCDHPGCTLKINRGLEFACGGMHGEDEISCEKYFCAEHLSGVELQDGLLSWFDRPWAQVCADCKAMLKEESLEDSNG